jgi:hypothetical protein
MGIAVKDAEGIEGKLIGPEPSDEREHYLRCPTCGQAVDMRKLGDIFHHEEPGHKPIPRN